MRSGWGWGRLLLAALIAATTQPACAREPNRQAADDPDTVAIARARWPRFPLLPDGRFPISAWCAPPVRETNDARYEEYAKAGLNVALFALEDPYLEPSNLKRLPVAARHHVYAILRDRRVDPDESYRPAWQSRVDSVVATYRSHPAFLAYFLADEPDVSIFSGLGVLNRRFAADDSLHPAYVNLLGCPGPGGAYHGLPFSAYLRRFVRQVRPSFFSIDQYVFRRDGDFPMFCAGMDTARQVSRETGTPFWAILLLTTHGPFRKLTQGELAWQANLALAHGASGIVWFTYWTPNPSEALGYRDGPIAYDGTRNPSYDFVARLNPVIEALGRELSPLRLVDVFHTGRLPVGGRALPSSSWLQVRRGGDLTLGFFEGRSARYALLVNRDYRASQQVLVSCPGEVERFATGDRSYHRAPASDDGVPLTLDPGGTALIRVAKQSF